MKHETVIRSNGKNRIQVFIDGKDISDIVTEIKFSHCDGESPVIEMKFSHCDIKIVSPQIPQLPEKLRDYYIFNESF